MRRPRSLVEVIDWSLDAGEFWYHIRDFVDEARRLRDPSMLAAEPRRLAGFSVEGDVKDAYVAAVAVALSREFGSPPPGWARDPSRALRKPWFAHPGSALRATLLAESPAPFRERNLFVSANALSRA